MGSTIFGCWLVARKMEKLMQNAKINDVKFLVDPHFVQNLFLIVRYHQALDCIFSAL
jgi:hypothetical protein